MKNISELKTVIERDFKEFFDGAGRRRDYIGELIVIKTRKLMNCRLKFARSTPKFLDISDPEYGIIRTKFRTSYYGDYKVPIGEDRNFDTLIVLGLNKEKKIIEKVFAIPKEYIEKKKFITITKTGQACTKYKIDAKPYNNAYMGVQNGSYSILEDKNIIIDSII